jgi:hypothetical protein
MSKDRDDLAFQKIADRFERRGGILQELASIEDAKNRLLTAYYRHLAAIEDVDFLASDATDSLYHRLNSLINRDSNHIDGLKSGDELVSTDDVVFMISDNVSKKVTPSAVLPDFTLKGEMCGLVVSNVPETTDVRELMELYANGQPIPMRPFGLSLMLWKSRQEFKGKTVTHYPSNETADITVWVPLDIHAVPMKKVIK